MSPSALLRVITACVLLSTATLHAQSYQTSFSDVKFDRAKGPATFTAGIEVDAASGAASINLPFGPGIGERGLKFRPVLSMRMAPQLAVSSTTDNAVMYTTLDGVQVWGTNTLETLYQRSFGRASFSPGTLDLGTLVSTFDRRKTTYNLPGGGGGRVLGQVPAEMKPSDAQDLLHKFGFNPNDTVGYLPGATARPTKAPFLQMGSDGSLVVGLRLVGKAVAEVADEVSADIQQYPESILYSWDFPRRIAVIQGEVAYEFHYVRHTYMTRPIPYLAINQKTQLYSGHYVITKIRNKYGESIEFTYDEDGIGYTAAWVTNPALPPSVKIRVQVVGSLPVTRPQTRLVDNRFQTVNATQIRVSYQGISQALSSYLLEVSDPTLGGALAPASGGPASAEAATGPHGVIDWDWVGFGTQVQSIQPIRVVQEGTSEQVTFTYGIAPTVTWGRTAVSPTVLTGVTFPTRTVSLVWQPYPFRMNYSPEAWGGVVSGSAPGRPAYGYGVSVIQDSEGTQTRFTKHKRVVPTSNWNDSPPGNGPPDQWVDSTFYDAITQPDGSISVHRFVSPPANNTTTGPDGMQNLAFIKTLEREVRYYAPGVKWEDDLSVTTPATSSAYKWVVKDRFEVRTPGSPDGSLAKHSVPYPTRTRTWDRESQVFTLQETTDWDGTAFGWKTTHTITAITAAPNFSLDYLSLSQQGLGYSPYPATLGLYRRVDKTFEPKVTDWIFARTKTEQSTTVADNTGSMASDVPLPNPQPLVTKTFNPSINRVESVAVGNMGAPTVTTAFTFQGTTGLAAFELQSAYLTSPDLVLSGQLGVSAYGYDPNGYLNAIGLKPSNEVTLKAQQESDELGRPTSQTDVNGVIKTFTRDQAGRLRGITSSDNEAPTTITYDDNDHRGITVTRGAQATEYRYNGFGELILERRTAPDGVKTHRLFGYDAAGRKTAETVWQPGDGANHEAEWIKPNLTRKSSTTTTTPSITVCKRYGFDADGNAICLSWQTIPGGTTTTESAAAYVGTAIAYDGQGRVTLTQDANGVSSTTDYDGPANLPPGSTGYVGPIRKVSVGAQVKWFESDAGGRLVRVTAPVTRFADPLRSTVISLQNLRTQYRYDGGDRIYPLRRI